jgi:hypothetical protein
VLTPAEFSALLNELSGRERAMVLLVGTTGLRRSEFVALTWADIDTEKMEIRVTRSCVRSRIGKTKTEGSAKPVPLHAVVLAALLEGGIGLQERRGLPVSFRPQEGNSANHSRHGAEAVDPSCPGAGWRYREGDWGGIPSDILWRRIFAAWEWM